MKKKSTQLIDLKNLNFNEGDAALFCKILDLEERLLNSSYWAHHLKDPSQAHGEKVSFEETMVTEAGIIGSMSNIEDMVKAYGSIIELREGMCLPASMLIHYGAIELSRFAYQSSNLVSINMGTLYLERCLAINSKLMNVDETGKVSNLLVFKALTNLSLLHSKVGGDTLLTAEYHKQAWLIGQKISVDKDNEFLNSVKIVLDKLSPGFTSDKDSSCLYITTRGEVKKDDLSLIIKAAILPRILSKIPDLVQEGKWSHSILGSDWGLKGYVNSDFVKKVLKSNTHCTAKDIEKAQMLCFETICAATLASKNKGGTKCLEEFIKEHPSLVSRVLSVHPEYCLDARMLNTCVDTFTKGEFEFDAPEIEYVNITLAGEVTDL